MKIALLGYGKMGKSVEQVALNRKHEIVLKVDVENLLSDLNVANLKKADVAIEFSTPHTVLKHINIGFEAHIPMVVGTTGWYAQLQEVKHTCEETKNALLYASNFSVGANILFHLNMVLAKLVNKYPHYDVQITETHHKQKLDRPSGTAITIAETIIEHLDAKSTWINELADDTADTGKNSTSDQLLIKSYRKNNVPGTHSIVYDSEVDSIELTHTAHNRLGFALGAVLAAEWLKDKTGCYSMKDIFTFPS